MQLTDVGVAARARLAAYVCGRLCVFSVCVCACVRVTVCYAAKTRVALIALDAGLEVRK